MDDGTISVGSLVFIARWLAKLRGAWEPGVRFGSPRQEATESHLSWWHVPVTLHRRFYQFATIKRCVIELQPPELPEARLPIAMRWRSRDAWNGVSEVELQAGRTDVVPLVVRDERTSDGHAVITNETFLNERREKWVLPPGRYLLKLRVRSGHRIVQSPHYYEVRVPVAGWSNGQFVLEITERKPD